MKAPVFLLAFILCGFASASAATLVVTKIEDTNDGVCDADCSLREAVAAAAGDDTVIFSSFFNTPQSITLALGQINITRSVTILGPGADLLQIQGNGSSRLFFISQAPVVTMSGMRLTGGRAYAVGGAIWGISVSLNLMNMVIAYNHAVGDHNPGEGGGVANSGMLTITNSSILGNIAGNELPPYVGLGGGIRSNGAAYIINCSVTNNNSALLGGGIYGGTIYLTNSTVSGNVVNDLSGFANSAGAGVYNSGTLTLTNATIANNLNYGGRGGVFNAGTVVARNSIIAGNGPGSDFWGPVVSEGNNLIGNTAGSSGWIASDLQNINPLLAPLGNNGGSTWTHALLPGSPAINAGNNKLARDPFDNSPLLNDQRGSGFLRLIGNVDIGAFEANWSTVPVTVGGRVTTLSGRGIPGVRLMLTDGTATYYTQTNPFGYYRFANLIPGFYTIAVTHKYYRFNSPQPVTIDQNRNDLNFTQQ